MDSEEKARANCDAFIPQIREDSGNRQIRRSVQAEHFLLCLPFDRFVIPQCVPNA